VSLIKYLDIVLLGGKFTKSEKKRRNRKERKLRRKEKRERERRKLEAKKANGNVGNDQTQHQRKSQNGDRKAEISNSSIKPEKITVMETRSKSHSKNSERQNQEDAEKVSLENKIVPNKIETEEMFGSNIYHRQAKEDQIFGAIIRVNNKTITYFFRYFENQKAFSIFNDVSRRCSWNINKIKIYWDRGKQIESQIPIIFYSKGTKDFIFEAELVESETGIFTEEKTNECRMLRYFEKATIGIFNFSYKDKIYKLAIWDKFSLLQIRGVIKIWF
jgi:hypothetical protein